MGRAETARCYLPCVSTCFITCWLVPACWFSPTMARDSPNRCIIFARISPLLRTTRRHFPTAWHQCAAWWTCRPSCRLLHAAMGKGGCGCLILALGRSSILHTYIDDSKRASRCHIDARNYLGRVQKVSRLFRAEGGPGLRTSFSFSANLRCRKHESKNNT